MNWFRIRQRKMVARLFNVTSAAAGDFLRWNVSGSKFEVKTVVVDAQLHTTAGGAATETVAIPGVLATDVVQVTLHTPGNTPRTIASAVAGTDEVDIVFSGDPADDHIVNILVIRPL